MGIDHIQFKTQRAAAYFGQHHAAGRTATLKLLTDGFIAASAPFHRGGEIPVPPPPGESVFKLPAVLPVMACGSREGTEEI